MNTLLSIQSFSHEMGRIKESNIPMAVQGAAHALPMVGRAAKAVGGKVRGAVQRVREGAHNLRRQSIQAQINKEMERSGMGALPVEKQIAPPGRVAKFLGEQEDYARQAVYGGGAGPGAMVDTMWTTPGVERVVQFAGGPEMMAPLAVPALANLGVTGAYYATAYGPQLGRAVVGKAKALASKLRKPPTPTVQTSKPTVG